MENKKETKIELYIKIGGFIILVIGTIITVLKFLNEDKRDEFQNGKKNKIYFELSDIVSNIMEAENDSTLKKYAKDFNIFYKGQMTLVEDTTVSKSMKRFKLELEDRLKGYTNLFHKDKLSEEGYKLMKYCREELE